MKGKSFKFIVISALLTAAGIFVTPKSVKAVDYETALALQQAATEAYYQIQEQQKAAAAAQQQAIADSIARQEAAAKAQQEAALAQQQALLDAVAAQQAALLKQQQDAQNAVLAQQKAAQEALTAQQKAAQDALSEQQKLALQAQQGAMEAAAAIQQASLTTPQVDVICDTNCSEKNALLYAKSVPDFVLVDVSEQRAIFYKNGMRVLADNCVTGNKRAGHDTTVGIHQIIFKDLNRTLHGSYGEAFVKYWMRFTKDGQGLHDAGWRRNFGSGIYISNGSHGCVNLPRETAATIYNNSYVGMFVIVEN